MRKKGIRKSKEKEQMLKTKIAEINGETETGQTSESSETSENPKMPESSIISDIRDMTENSNGIDQSESTEKSQEQSKTSIETEINKPLTKFQIKMRERSAARELALNTPQTTAEKKIIKNSYHDLCARIKQSGKQYNMEKIRSAFVLADECHAGQNRISGEPYITHPIAVSIILVELGMDTDSIVAALLHDVVEDTEMELETIKKLFSDDVALLVDGVTKLGKIEFISREEEKAENTRKMLLAMSQDIRVIIIKLADRLHNLRTIEVRKDSKRREIALETMEIFAPIAHRLGIRAVKEELEDISLKYLDPVAYFEIETALAGRRESRGELIVRMKQQIGDRLAMDFDDFRIEARVKSIYGIYNKMYLHNKNFEEIYDIYAVRIIVPTVTDCYNCLGVIHDIFTPIPNRFKDYISTPKPNMYQSLHTTVIGKDGVPFEVQIRTFEMHHTAEYGIAAHWKYKEGIKGTDKLDERLAWVRQLLEAQQDSEDVEDIIRTIKSDIAPEEVFVFTPKGDVISLPTGSNVIDFAYAIHSAVGNKMIGAKIDGRMVSFNYLVKTGEIVEVLTTKSANQGPNREWLKIVKTSEAKNKIRAWFKKEKREENISCGKSELEKEFKRNGITLTTPDYEEFLLSIAKRQHCDTIDDFYASVGYGGLILSRIMSRVKEDYIKQYKEQAANDLPNQLNQSNLSNSPINQGKTHQDIEPFIKTRDSSKSSNGVVVEGIKNCLVKFAKCCNPVPGDDIVGFITRGHGVSVHKRDCINVQNSINDDNEKYRFISVDWENDVIESFKSNIEIIALGRNSILADISVTLANMKIGIHALNAKELKNTNIYVSVTVAINSLEHLKTIISKLEKIDGVISVQRSTT